MNTQTHYIASGAVRGPCSHHHQTFAAADRCARKDQRDCAKLSGGAYSDRSAIAVEVEIEPRTRLRYGSLGNVRGLACSHSHGGSHTLGAIGYDHKHFACRGCDFIYSRRELLDATGTEITAHPGVRVL